MNVELFEKQITAKRLTPIHLFCARGGRVKWFVCLDTRPLKEYALIVYDCEGKALVLPEYHESITAETSFHIQTYPGGVSINSLIPQRDSRLDLDLAVRE